MSDTTPVSTAPDAVNPTDITTNATTTQLKKENVILLQEQMSQGPRGYESVYGTSYVTRAVCTSEDAANTQMATLTEADEAATFVLLKVPLDTVFPRGLPPGAEPAIRQRQHYHKSMRTEDNDAHLENLQVPASTYTRDRKIREAEMRQRLNVQPMPQERRHPVTQSNSK